MVFQGWESLSPRRRRGRELVNHFVGELNGERAPADGTVFIVPVQYQQLVLIEINSA